MVVVLIGLKIESRLRQMIKEAQKRDEKLSNILERVQRGNDREYMIANDGALYYKDRLCVPDSNDLKRSVMDEAHLTKYTMHPGGNKMYRALKQHYWWPGMK